MKRTTARAAAIEQPTPDDLRLLTPPELAERFGVPVATLYRWNHLGTGPRYMKIGIHVRYRFTDVIAWETAQYAPGSGRNAGAA